MTAIAIRRAMTGSRRRIVVALALLCIGSAVAVHHTTPSELGSMAGHAICPAVLAVGLVAVVALAAAGARRLGPTAPPRALLRLTAVTVDVLAPRSTPAQARAGPLYLRLGVLRI